MLTRYLHLVSRFAYFTLGVAVGILLFMGYQHRQQGVNDAIVSGSAFSFMQLPAGETFRGQSLAAETANQADESISVLTTQKAELERSRAIVQSSLQEQQATINDLEQLLTNGSLSADETATIQARLDRLQTSQEALQSQLDELNEQLAQVDQELSVIYDDLQGTINSALSDE